MTDSTEADPNPEPYDTPFTDKSWLIRVTHVGDHLVRRLEASEQLREWLAQEVDALSCDSLTCDVELKPGRRGRFIGSLHIQAVFQQTCVITVEQLETRVDETLPAEFWPAKQIEFWVAERGKEAEIDVDTPDPEPIVDERMAIGPIVHQVVVMAVDPNPRKDGVEFGSVSTETEAEREAEKPFAGLAKLRDTLN